MHLINNQVFDGCIERTIIAPVKRRQSDSSAIREDAPVLIALAPGTAPGYSLRVRVDQNRVGIETVPG
jgi:hypothetical protein